MVHPATNFVRYLLVSLDDLDLKAINKVVRDYGLVPLKAEELQSIVEEMPAEPADFRPWDKNHRPSTKWLRSVKIFSLIHRDAPVNEMFEAILKSPRLREDIERMLIGGVSFMEVSYRLQRLGRKASPLAVAEFQHYFWNVPSMGMADWTQYFASASSSSRTGSLEKEYAACLLGGPELALYRSGVESELNTKEMMEGLMRELWFTFKEVKTLPLSAKKIEMLANLVRGMTRVDERLQASDTALQDVLRQFEKFKVIHDEEVLPGLHELAPGGTVSKKTRGEILVSREN
jgi:hypothetical protein